jgi:hypothetical protein
VPRLTAREFVVSNAGGRELAKLSPVEGGSVLRQPDAAGVVRAGLVATEKESGQVAHDEERWRRWCACSARGC